MRRAIFSITAIVAVAAMLIWSNMQTEYLLANTQLDLTQGHLYTLAPGTKRILAGLKDPVTLRLYYSPQLGVAAPQYGAYADRVREMLRQYAQLSGGKIKLQFLNPEPFSDTEDQAIGFGLQPVPLTQTGDQVYFGLAGTNLLDDTRSIPFFTPDREPFLEYDLTRLVHALSDPKESVVGVMTSLPMLGDPRLMMAGRGGGQPWVSMQELRQGLIVRPVPLNAAVIDPDVQVLMVAQAQNLPEQTVYAIDQFVMRGGRLIAFVDPLSESELATPDPSGMPPQNTSSDLPKLFDAWGISFDPNKVVGDLAGAWRVRANVDGRTQAVDYVPWFTVRGDGIAHDDPAMADVRQIGVASAGALAKKDGASIDFTPLLRSSAQSETIPVATVRDLPNPAKILAEFKPEGGPRVVAARIHGVLKSAFSAPPAPAKGETPAANLPPYKAQTDGPANIVVVADSDILADRFWVRVQDFFGQPQASPFNDNGAFLANVVGTLTGGDDLIGLRARGESLRPFTMVDDMQRRAEAQYRQTEKGLQDHLQQTQKQLADLRTGHGDQAAGAVLTPDQRTAIDNLQRDAVQTRGKLRAVQLDLKRDIDALETRLRLYDIIAVPVVLALIAIVLGIARSRRRARAHG